MNRRMVLFALVILLLTGASARSQEAIVVGEEIPLLKHGPGGDLQRTPHVAFGEGVYLVVWQEGWEGEGGKARIFAARLSREGKLLDPKGIELSPNASGVQTRPRVTFGGGVFLVVWQELRGGQHNDVVAVTVSPSGKVLNEVPSCIAGGGYTQALPDVASDGENFVVVWQEAVEENGGLTYYSFARAVSAAGIAGNQSRLLGFPNPRIAWHGRSYLVALSQMRAVRLDASAQPIDEEKQALTIYHTAGVRYRHFSLAANSRGWLVIVDRSQPDYWGWGGPGAIMCTFLQSDGKIAPDYEEYIKSLPGNERNTPKYKLYDHWLDGSIRGQGTWPYGESACTWDGKQFVAVWQRHHLEKTVMFKNCDLLASRLERWRPLDRPAVVVADSQAEEQQPALASDGAGGLLCVYEKHAADGKVLVTARALKAQ